MNQIIPAVCALALISSGAYAQRGVCCARRVTSGTQWVYSCQPVPGGIEAPYPKPLKVATGCTDSYRAPYFLCPRPSRHVPLEYVEVGNTERALAMRQAAIIRQREIVQFEKGLLAASTPITQPSSTGTTIFGETEGAGVFDNGCAPIPPAYSGVPAEAALRGVRVPPVGETLPRGSAPCASPVPGRPGCIHSPAGRAFRLP